MAISRSLQGDHLAAADPQWLRTIVRGQRLLTTGLLAAISGLYLLIFGGVTFLIITDIRSTLPRSIEYGFYIGFGAAFVSLLIGVYLGLVGTYFMTVQEGREIDRESVWSTRRMARWSMLGVIVTCILVYSSQFLSGFGMRWVGVEILSRSLFILMLTVAGVSLLKRLEALIRRVPDEPLAKKIRSHWILVRWAVPAVGIYVLILPQIGFGGGGMGRTMRLLLAMPLVIAGFIGAIALMADSIRIFFTMRKCTATFQDCRSNTQLPSEQTAR
ncbi:MAG: hypothetical protein EA377_00225 [Phycisphaerales bacterium]|nr:MAG: hypothetical protein EA377_00225 [Phycisphaerales bacterium]